MKVHTMQMENIMKYDTKSYTTKEEALVYKIAKLTVLINRFAHLYDGKFPKDQETPKTREELFAIKEKLIHEILKMAHDNPDITIIRANDDKTDIKNAIILEIPGYSIIGFHVKRNEYAELYDELESVDPLQSNAEAYYSMSLTKSLKVDKRYETKMFLTRNNV